MFVFCVIREGKKEVVLFRLSRRHCTKKEETNYKKDS